MLEISKAILGLVVDAGVLLATGLDCLLDASHWMMVGDEDGPLRSSTDGVFTDNGENPAADQVLESMSQTVSPGSLFRRELWKRSKNISITNAEFCFAFSK